MRKIDRVKNRFVEESIDTALNWRKGSSIQAKKADGDFEAPFGCFELQRTIRMLCEMVSEVVSRQGCRALLY